MDNTAILYFILRILLACFSAGYIVATFICIPTYIYQIKDFKNNYKNIIIEFLGLIISILILVYIYKK